MTAEPIRANDIDLGRYSSSAGGEPLMTKPLEIRLPIADITP